MSSVVGLRHWSSGAHRSDQRPTSDDQPRSLQYAMRKDITRELLAEFLGTFTLIVFGVGVVPQVVLSKQTAGTYPSINIARGLGVTMGCYVAAGVSGAPPNPAATPGLAADRR